MTLHAITTAWARDFNNQRRHCFEDKDGNRWREGNINTRCTEEHDPKLTGPTEWLRFIREFGGLFPVQVQTPPWEEIANPFTSEDAEGLHFLFNEVDGHTTSDGRRTYCETYLRRKSADSWGLNPVFRVFLANDEGWARIECYDEKLVGLCEQALASVERSYREEVTA